MPEKYCVGPSMAVDWGDQHVEIGRGLVLRALRSFLPYWRRGLLTLACIGAAAALGLAPALVTKGLIDYLGHPGQGAGPLLLLVAAGAAATVGAGLVGVLRTYLSTSISEGIMFDLREQLFDRLLAQSVGFFASTRAGDLLSRMDNDVGGIQAVVSDTVFGLLSNLLVVVATLTLMVVLDWRLTLAGLVLMPIVLLPARRVGRATFRARKRTQEKLSEMAAYMQEVLGISGILLVKAFTKELDERRRFRAHNDNLRQLQVQQAMIGRWFSMFSGVLTAFGPSLLLLFGGYLVLTGRTSVGTVISVVTILAGRLTSAAGNLASTQVNITGSLALFQRIFQYLDLPPDVADREGALELEHVRGELAFEEVGFTYPGTTRAALEDVSFRVEPGQLVALVGPSGAGKTTVTYLLARFYDPASGRVRLDGADLRDVSLRSLSAHLGVVFQDSYLFHASIRENLLYARPDSTLEEMEAATRAAQIHDFIQSLPQGYDTVVGERGHRLSGGEKQRMAIARAILKDPRLVILDEATSSLDTVSEQLIQAALRPLFAGRTSFVIAHRLSTVLAADLILVLDHGRLVERGTHHQLLQRGGLYRTLYESQFASGPPGAETAALA